ncbi:MAG: hypothetical protein M0R06_02855 [Sphaerochaeta sp.]|nr:hypothetical protein [Sphaerochaeta sp.]
MKGIPEVERIMALLSRHIKEGADECNRQHYNYIYEAVWKVLQIAKEEQAEAAGLRLELSAARAERDNNRALANGLEAERDRLREELRAKKSEI